MKIRTSTKLFVIALAFYASAFACYLWASKIYDKELEKQLPARLFWGIGIVASPDLNWWYFLALAMFCTAIAITVADIILRKSK